MAVFVDLDEEPVEPHPGQSSWPRDDDLPVRRASTADPNAFDNGSKGSCGNGDGNDNDATEAEREGADEVPVRENPNWNSMTRALGCFP
jgi:hypothetical protein